MKLLLWKILGALVVPATSFMVAPTTTTPWSSTSTLAATAGDRGGTDICPLLPPPEDPSSTLEVAAG